MRIAVQSRKYTYQGAFDASPALTCAFPVWTYRTVPTGMTCKQPDITWNTGGVNWASPPNCPGSGGGIH